MKEPRLLKVLPAADCSSSCCGSEHSETKVESGMIDMRGKRLRAFDVHFSVCVRLRATRCEGQGGSILLPRLTLCGARDLWLRGVWTPRSIWALQPTTGSTVDPTLSLSLCEHLLSFDQEASGSDVFVCLNFLWDMFIFKVIQCLVFFWNLDSVVVLIFISCLVLGGNSERLKTFCSTLTPSGISSMSPKKDAFLNPYIVKSSLWNIVVWFRVTAQINCRKIRTEKLSNSQFIRICFL